MIIPRNIEYALNSANRERGFTLIELMIALFVSGLVMATVVSIYIAQTRAYSELDDVAGIQQDLRGALLLLPLEMRLAGCDPLESNAAGILTATNTQFRFTTDIKGDPGNSNSGDGDVDDPNEDITFGLATDADNDGNPDDSNNNGIIDNGGADWSSSGSLARDTGGGFQPLADNIEALEFNYILDDGTSTLAPTSMSKIREVQVSILARATNPASGFLNTRTYTTASGVVWDPPDDNFRRRMVVTNIQLRNMGY